MADVELCGSRLVRVTKSSTFELLSRLLPAPASLPPDPMLVLVDETLAFRSRLPLPYGLDVPHGVLSTGDPSPATATDP